MLQLVEVKPVEIEGKQRLTFIAPSRGLIGFRLAIQTPQHQVDQGTLGQSAQMLLHRSTHIQEPSPLTNALLAALWLHLYSVSAWAQQLLNVLTNA